MTVIINPSQFHGVARELTKGILVQRAADTLPATTTEDLFSIDDGPVLLVALYGIVTTVIQTQACNLSVTHDADSGGDTTLATTLDISADPVGLVYSLNTTAGGALIGAGASAPLAHPVILNVGDILITTSATNTGAIRWGLVYVPLDSDGVVTAV